VLDDFHPTERPKWVEIARFSFRVSVDTNKPLNLVIHLSKSKRFENRNNRQQNVPSNTGETAASNLLTCPDSAMTHLRQIHIICPFFRVTDSSPATLLVEGNRRLRAEC